MEKTESARGRREEPQRIRAEIGAWVEEEQWWIREGIWECVRKVARVLRAAMWWSVS